MAFTAYELLVKFGITGTDKVTSGLKTTKDGVKGVGDESAKTASRLTNLQSVLTRTFEVAAMAHARFVALSIVTGGIMGGSAVKASTDFAELNARLQAVTGAADVAARKLAFAQKVADPSNFTFKQLADATSILEAFGINAERALPTVAKLGMAFGAGNEQLQMLVRGMGDIASGSMMQKDVMASFGLNQSMFKEKGIKFDGQGSLKSDAISTLKALESIVTERYSKIFDVIAKTPGAKLASFQDSMEKFSRAIGDGILIVAAPALQRLTTLVNSLTMSGVLPELINKFSTGIADMFGGLQGDGLTRFASNVLAVISNLPAGFKAVKEASQDFARVVAVDFDRIGKYAVALFNSLSLNADILGNYFATKFGGILNTVNQLISSALGSLLKTIQEVSKFVGPVFGVVDRQMKGLEQSIRGIQDSLSEDVSKKFQSLTDKIPFFPLPSFPKIEAPKGIEAVDMLQGADGIFKRLQAASQSSSSGVPAASGNWLTRQVQIAEDSNSAIKDIVKNTAKTVDVLSLRRQSIGGGELAAIGATPAELRGGGGGGSYSGGGVRPGSYEELIRNFVSGMRELQRNDTRSMLSRQSGNGSFPR